MPQQDRSRRARNRTRGGRAVSSPGGGTDNGGAGEFGVQLGSDGADPAVGIGGNLTVDLADGDIGLRIARGVSIDLTD